MFTIKTIRQHKRRLAKSPNDFDKLALSALELGIKTIGEELPYGRFEILVRDNTIISTEKLSVRKVGVTSWIIEEPKLVMKLGRKLIPYNKNGSSNVQRKLGLQQVYVTIPVKRSVMAPNSNNKNFRLEPNWNGFVYQG